MFNIRYPLWLPVLLLASGCGLLPDIAHRPVIFNPFPQLSRVAVAPFFNLSDEPTVDGRRIAIAYFNELQALPGFEVVPVGVVETAIRQHRIDLSGPGAARRLAQILDVDAVVIGAVTEYSPYYPPRCGLQVEWWAANPCFHPIPPGYGLPWGTSEEEFIPPPLVFEAEMAQARAELKAQTPAIPPETGSPPVEGQGPELLPVPGEASIAPNDLIVAVGPEPQVLPANGHEEQALFLPPPGGMGPDCKPSHEPVLRHTRIYHGNDSDFTEALANYAYFRDEARYGGWQAYLQRSEDFIRFCCHMHIAEMLSARGGAGKTRVVWRWSHDR